MIRCFSLHQAVEKIASFHMRASLPFCHFSGKRHSAPDLKPAVQEIVQHPPPPLWQSPYCARNFSSFDSCLEPVTRGAARGVTSRELFDRLVGLRCSPTGVHPI